MNTNIDKQLSPQERFEKRVRELYGNIYDLSLAEYRGREKPITLICKKHGNFTITPRVLLNGDHRERHGCPACFGITIQRKITQQDFEAIVKEKYGDKYDISSVIYRNRYQILNLVCPDCGETFKTNPKKLLEGKGCDRCEGRIKDLRYYTERAKAVHGNKYDYSECTLSKKGKFVYLNSIKCKIHGYFSSRAGVHIDKKSNCPKCAGYTNKIPKWQRRDAYILKAIKKFGEGKFDYSQVVYINKRTKVWIKCNEHNRWIFISLEDHARGSGGCPECSESEGELETRLYLEKKKIEFQTQVKVENIHPKELDLQYLVADFYLPKYRLFIEYNGEQHYKDCTWLQIGKRTLAFQQLRDQTLREFCELNNYNLLEIHYKDKDKIGKIIQEKLKSIKTKKRSKT